MGVVVDIIDVLDIIAEILVDLGFKRSYELYSVYNSNSFRFTGPKDDSISILSEHNRMFNIRHVECSKISIFSFYKINPNNFTYIDLCDPDCIDRIKEVLSSVDSLEYFKMWENSSEEYENNSVET